MFSRICRCRVTLLDQSCDRQRGNAKFGQNSLLGGPHVGSVLLYVCHDAVLDARHQQTHKLCKCAVCNVQYDAMSCYRAGECAQTGCKHAKPIHNFDSSFTNCLRPIKLRWGVQGFLDGSIDDLSHEDVFDSPEAEPDQIFINPFACSVNPLDWRQLQQVAGACGQEELCEAELLRQGVYMQSSSAVCWLTPGQLAGVVADLTAMESNLNFEITSWLVNDCLVRAERANNRMPVTWR